MIFVAKHIDGLPFATINTLLSLDLKHGNVHISDKAIQHIRERHPEDFSTCLAALENIIRTPECIGQEPHHRENFEVIGNISGLWVLVAICSIMDDYGDYPILSSYPIPNGTFQRRLRKGYIQRIP